MSAASDDHYEGGVEYAAAVAAAAFAISMLDSATRKELHSVGGPEPSMDRIKSQKETVAQAAKPDSESESSSDEEKTDKGQSKVDSSKPESDEGEMPEKLIHPVPSTRRKPRFSLSSKDFEEIGSMKPKLDIQKPRIPPPPPPPSNWRASSNMYVFLRKAAPTQTSMYAHKICEATPQSGINMISVTKF